MGYFRYMDDILIFYDQRKTNIEETLTELNEQRTIDYRKGSTQLH
jgi:hypothetical protein